MTMLAKPAVRYLKNTRHNRAAPDDVRCVAHIPWGNGEVAQCARRRVDGEYCRQHAAMAKKK